MKSNTATTKRSARSIIRGHLEKVSSRIFDQNRALITEMIRGRYGVYALYRRDKLYYVGLATDLRKRINRHLRDRHKAKWTHFSLYILRQSEHLREVESLILRIADPTGNYMKGNLKGSKDLRPKLKTLLADDYRKAIDDILGMKRESKQARTRRKTSVPKHRLPLTGLLRNGQAIYARYKGVEYRALVYSTGLIRFRRKRYSSPSAAALAILERGAVNGWRFWKYKDASGDLRPLSDLRK
jgi:hypothetical protein